MNEKGFVSEKRFVSKKNLSRAWRRLFGKVLNSKEEIEANTSENMIAGAEAVKEVYSSLTDQPTFEYDESGKITGYKTKIGGADTVFPFKNIKSGSFKIDHFGSYTINLGLKPKFLAFLSDSDSKITVYYDETLGHIYTGYTFDNGWLTITDTGFVWNQANNWGTGTGYYMYY